MSYLGFGRARGVKFLLSGQVPSQVSKTVPDSFFPTGSDSWPLALSERVSMLLGNAQGDANMLIACQLILSESIPTATEEESLVLDALPLLAEVAKEAAHASTLPSQATSSGAAASAVKVTFDQIGQA